MQNAHIIYYTIKQASVYSTVNAALYKGLLMPRFKGCPRCGKKMPLEIKGQCLECKSARYKYRNNLPGIKSRKVQEVYDDPRWKKVRYEVIKRAKGLCEVCKCHGRVRSGQEVHHIIKVRQGDGNTNYNMDNLIYVCVKCHKKIEGLNHEQLLEYLQGGR